MGISNLATGLRPGVCTSTTRPSSPFEGQMIYETDTNRVLVYDNAAWVMIADTDTPPGMQLVKTQAVGTGVSSTTVTDAFVDDFNVYKIMWVGGTMSANQNMTMYMGSSTGSAYYGARQLISTGGSAAPAGDSNTNSWSYVGYGMTDDAFCDITLANPNLARPTKVSGVLFDYVNYFGTYAGVLSNTTTYTSFTLDPGSTATMTGGTIYVYGFRK